MPSPIIHHDTFASSLTPDQRSYIQNYVAAQVEPVIQTLSAECKRLMEINASLHDEISTLRLRVERAEARFIDDSKYALTRPKIVSFMREHGIE